MGKKFINIIKMIKNDKRFKYTLVVTIMLLFISIIGYSLSFFNNNNSTLVANIKVNDLLFNMTTNSGESDDRILRLQAGKTESFYVKLKNLNSINAKYELKYSVCSDSNCTNTSSTLPDNVKILVTPNCKSKINGEISSNENNLVEIELLTLNYSNEDIYIKLNLNAGYIWNDLALENQFEVSASDGKNQEKNIDIIAYVDGIEAEEYPRSCNYLAKIKGYNGDVEVLIPESYVVCDRKTNTWKMVVDVLVKKVVINFTYKVGTPAFTYTGKFEIVNGDTADWKINLLSSGTFTFIEAPQMIDVFLVGGGGGGAGGYGLTTNNILISKNITYNIVIGAGGQSGKAGSTTSAFEQTVSGGEAGKTGQANDTYPNGYGGAGGTGGNKGGTGHGDSNQNSKAETGASGATSTKEFGIGTAYAGGGGGGGHCQWSSTTAGASGGVTGGGAGGQGSAGKNGTANTGGGGGGGGAPSAAGTTKGGTGGSGIVVIRAHQATE